MNSRQQPQSHRSHDHHHLFSSPRRLLAGACLQSVFLVPEGFFAFKQLALSGPTLLRPRSGRCRNDGHANTDMLEREPCQNACVLLRVVLFVFLATCSPDHFGAIADRPFSWQSSLAHVWFCFRLRCFPSCVDVQLNRPMTRLGSEAHWRGMFQIDVLVGLGLAEVTEWFPVCVWGMMGLKVGSCLPNARTRCLHAVL